MRANELIQEIELIGDVEFPKSAAELRLQLAVPHSKLGDFIVYFHSDDDIRLLFLVDSKKQLAAIAFFISKMNDRVWQAKNTATYEPHRGKKLAAQLYKIVKTDFHKSIQSDLEQTSAGAKLWTSDLPDIGLAPKIYDHTTDRIIDPKTQKVNAYPGYESPEIKRYSWIIERNDYYPEQNLIKNQLLLPITGRWSNR